MGKELALAPEVQELLESTSPSQELGELQQLRVDVGSRSVWCCGSLDLETTAELMRTLMFLDTLSAEGPITIYLNTDGGSASSALALVDLFQILQSQVRVVGFGRVMSAGAIVLAAADVRVVFKSTTVMVHAVYTPVGGEDMGEVAWRRRDHMENVVDLDYLNGACGEILRARTHLNPTVVLDGHDHYFHGGYTIVRVGLADKVAFPGDVGL